MVSSDGQLEGPYELSDVALQIAESIESSSAGLYVIVTHYDADGLAAASIIARSLMKIERPFVVRVVDQIDEETLTSLPKGDYYVFVDLGSSAVRAIADKGLLPASVIDHHEPLRSSEVVGKELRELNPHIFGLNGGRDVSASGLAYFVSKGMKVLDHEIAYLAIAGAIGDRQESAQGFVGLNKLIAQEAIERGWVRRFTGLRLYGVPRYPLVKSLMYTVDPLLPGLTYDEAASERFLESLGITLKKSNGPLTTYKDLSVDEISKLATALIKHLLMKGFSPQSANALFGFIYEFLYEPEDSPLRYAHEFAQTLNACGRLRKHGLGLAIGLGDRKEALSQVEAISLEYRRRLTQYLSLLRSDPSYIRVLNNVQVMDMRNVVDERILGAVASIAVSSYMCDASKPLISLAHSIKGKVKVSARMHEALSKRGINLGFIIKTAAEEVGGSGGGHENAAGAIIPSESLNTFIKTVDLLVGKSLKAGARS